MKKKNLLTLCGVLFMLSFCLAFGMGFTSNAAETMVVGCKLGINVRSGPSTSSAVIGSYEMGDTVLVNGSEGEWYQIDYNGQKGYVHSANLYSEDTDKFIVDCKLGVNVRADADANAAIIGGYDCGTIITATGEKKGWVEVDYNGKKGYIFKDNLSIPVGNNLSASASDSSEQLSAAGTTLRVIPKQGVNVRSGPTTDAPILGSFECGELITITGSKNGWYQIDYKDTVGYIYSQWLAE